MVRGLVFMTVAAMSISCSGSTPADLKVGTPKTTDVAPTFRSADSDRKYLLERILIWGR